MNQITIQEPQRVKNNISQLLSDIKSYGALYPSGMEYFCSTFDRDNIVNIQLEDLVNRISNDTQNGVEYDKNSSQFLFVTGLMEMMLDNISKQDYQVTSLENMEEFFFKKREVLNTRYREYQTLIEESLVNKGTLRKIRNLIGQLKNVNLVLIDIIEKQAEESFDEALEDKTIALEVNLKELEKMEKHLIMLKNLQEFEENSTVNKPTIDDMLFGGINDPTPYLKPEQLTRDNSSVERNNSGNSSSTGTKTSSNLLRKRFGKVQRKIMEEFGIPINSVEKPSSIQGKIDFFNKMGERESQENETHLPSDSRFSVGSGQVKNLTDLFEQNTFGTANFSSINETSSQNQRPLTSTPLSKGRQRHDSYESVDSGISSCSSETTDKENNVSDLIKMFEQEPTPSKKGPLSDPVLSDVDVSKLRKKFEVEK